MPICIVCNKSFPTRTNAKTCSPICSSEHRAALSRERLRAWRRDNPSKVKQQKRRQYLKNQDREQTAALRRYRANREAAMERNRQWKTANPDKVQSQRTRYRLANRPKLLASLNRWRAANPDWNKHWRAANRDRCLKARRRWRALNSTKERERTRLWFAANPDKARQSFQRWRKNNPERVRTSNRNRRAHKKAAEGNHTLEEIQEILTAQKYRCAYCRTKLTAPNFHIDHIVALSRGGTNYRSNLQGLCRRCNCSKNAKDPIDYAQSIGLLV